MKDTTFVFVTSLILKTCSPRDVWLKVFFQVPGSCVSQLKVDIYNLIQCTRPQSLAVTQSFDIYREFYGIDDSFPVSQLLVRSLHGKKRNIYLVSKAVKDVMEMVDDSHKVSLYQLLPLSLTLFTLLIETKLYWNLLYSTFPLSEFGWWFCAIFWQVINTGMKVFARAENDNVKCSFRLMQEVWLSWNIWLE